MRRLGGILMALGLVVGALMAAAVIAGADWFGVHWVIWVGMVKLGVAGALGLIVAGAFLRRAARRREQRALTEIPERHA